MSTTGVTSGATGIFSSLADPVHSQKMQLRQANQGVRNEALSRIEALLNKVSTPGKMGVSLDETGHYALHVDAGSDKANQKLETEIEDLFKNDKELNDLLGRFKTAADIAPAPDTASPPTDAKHTGDLYQVNDQGDRIEISDEARRLAERLREANAGLGRVAERNVIHSYYTGPYGGGLTGTSADPSSIRAGYEGEINASNTISLRADPRLALNSLTFSRYAWRGEQTAEEAATGYAYYTKAGRVAHETGNALNDEAKALQTKITQTLKDAGITLDRNDALKIKVGADGKIVVDPSGLKGKNAGQSKKIEDTLNKVPGLAESLRLNAAGRMLNHRSTSAGMNGDTLSARESGAQRVLMDDWLQSNFGFGLDSLSLNELGGLDESNANVNVLMQYAMGEESGLGQRWTHMMGDVATLLKSDNQPFEAGFTLQNDILVDDAQVARASAFKPSSSTGEMFDAAKKANLSVVVDADGGVRFIGADGKETSDATASKHLRDAMKEGSLAEFADQVATLLQDHAAKNGGKAEDYQVIYRPDGGRAIVGKNEIAASVRQEGGAARTADTGNLADAGQATEAASVFAHAFRNHLAFLGRAISQTFAVEVNEEGHIRLAPGQASLPTEDHAFLADLLGNLNQGIADKSPNGESPLLSTFRKFLDELPPGRTKPITVNIAVE